MSTLVTFFKSDAMAEAFPNEDGELVITLPKNVQLTYTELRDTRSGEPIAAFTAPHVWLHLASDTHWSDVVIGDTRVI